MSDETTHGGVNGGRNTTMTASSGTGVEALSASVAMVTMEGTIRGESEVAAQIAIVTAVGREVGIAIAGMIGTAGDEATIL